MDINTFFSLLSDDLGNFYHSAAFSFIEFFLGIYAIIIFADIVLLMIQRGTDADYRQMMSGANIPPELTRNKEKMRKRWRAIRKRLDTRNESQYKVAIIEADSIIDELVKQMGYAGNNFHERLSNIPAGQLEHLDDMKAAHQVRNRIIHEENFQVNHDLAKETLAKYEHLLKYFEVLD